MTKLYKVRPLPCKSKKVWTVEERNDMLEFATLEYPAYKNKVLVEIITNMEKLGITLEESVELYEFDRNPTEIVKKFEEFEKKEENTTKKLNAQEKKTLKAKKQAEKAKSDEVKTLVCDDILELLSNQGQKSPQLVKNGQICFIGTDGQYYTLKLTKNKTCPAGYVETGE